MIKFCAVIFLSILLSPNVFAQLTVKEVACDYRINPENIDKETPALSWVLWSPKRNTNQIAYRILVADNSALLQQNIGNIWDSKKIVSDQSTQVPFAGKSLLATRTYYWKVMVWDNHQNVSASYPAKWQMGLLRPADWKGAQWIGYDKIPDSLKIVPAIDSPEDPRWNKGTDILPLVRKSFFIKKEIKKATIYITGLGQFDLSLNGKKVGDHFMDPGWTCYDKQSLYVAFDITKQLRQGENALGVMLGNGFYFVPGQRYHKLRGAFGYPKMICRTLIEYTDGSQQNIVTDKSWKTAPGPVTFSSIYGGEDFDARMEQKGWDQPGFNDTAWKKSILVEGPRQLDAQTEEPLKILDQFSPKSINQPKPGMFVYDMGQNASGIPSIQVKGKKGSVIKITPSELITSEGLADQSAVGEPVYFNYTLKGEGVESWHPQFMYYGFRYIQVDGAQPDMENKKSDVPSIISVKSLHTRNSAKTIGEFECDNELFNKIFKLIDWAIKSNMASIFTDCPHREKLGWLEEAHLVGSSIRYNYDIATLCRKVIKDMSLSQTPDGLIPDIAPEYVQFKEGFRDSPEWGSNGIIIPWYMYQWYGDKSVLTENYEMMKRYVNYLGRKAQDNMLYFGLGDWYDIGPKDPGASQLTPPGVTSTAIYYYDLNIMRKVAVILGKIADADGFAIKAAAVRKAYNNKFYNKQTGQYATGSQAANAMSIYMELVDPANKTKVLANLIRDIREHNNGVTAGDIGYRYLLRVLDDNGYPQVIYDMNRRMDVPGYGLQLARGATSLTESWQGNRNSSNNHFMLGHLMEWFYSGLAGIKAGTGSTAFKTIIIRPEMAGDVTKCKASYLSPYGTVSNEWKKTGPKFEMSTTIPVNTSATIYLPAANINSVREDGKPIAGRLDLKYIKSEQGRVLVRVGSGNYKFIVN